MQNAGFSPDELDDEKGYQLEEIDSNKSAGDAVGTVLTQEELEQEEQDRINFLQDEEDNKRLAKYSLLSFIPSYRDRQERRETNPKQGKTWWGRWHKVVTTLGISAAYLAYFISVLSLQTEVDEDYWCDGGGMLVVLTAITVIFITYFTIKGFYGKQIYKGVMKPIGEKFDTVWKIKFVPWVFAVVVVAAIALFYGFDTKGQEGRLQSLFGTFVLIFLGFVFSAAPRAIIWRHVLWGLGIQFLMGLFILRIELGRAVFKCMGDKVSTFLAFTDQGSNFVFGPLMENGNALGGAIFAFYVLPVTLFFSFCVAVLYYFGIMQWVVFKLGWLLQVTVGTTMCESVNAAANIFLGQTEAPLIIRPFIPVMTKSEIHAVLTGGFATIAGSVMAAYIKLGIPAQHLLSASVMSAPAALAYAKLFYPETEVSKTTSKNMPVIKSKEANVLHAAIEGVVVAIPLVANIAANLICFIAFIALFNNFLNWGCVLIDIEDGFCTFENLFGYIFQPLAFVMGVQWSEAHKVGTLIAYKTIVNEFVAYDHLHQLIKDGNISKRSEIIATYALCGFSNISSIGIQLGGIGALAPTRRRDISKVVLRAMIAGSAACFLTACIAGSLLDTGLPHHSADNSTVAMMDDFDFS